MGCSGSSAKEPKAAAKGSTTAAAPGKQDSGDAHGAEFTVVLDQIVSKVRSLGDRATEHYQTLQGQIMEIEEQSFRNAEDAFHENGVATSAFAGAEEPALKLHTLCKQPGDIAEQPPFLEVAAGDRLEIILRNADGWSFCRKSDGKPPGWLPAGGVAEIAEAIADHGSMESQDLLAVKVGELVEVVSRHYSGWSFCRRWKEPGKDHPPEEGVRLRNEGWVTDAYLDDRRSEAALATKWQRLILEALGRVVRTARDLEAVVVNVRAKDSGGDTSSEWMVQCLEYTAWLAQELQSIMETVAQRDLAKVKRGAVALAAWDSVNPGPHELELKEGDRLVVLVADHNDWVWCHKAAKEEGSDPLEGWVPRIALKVQEGEVDDSVGTLTLNTARSTMETTCECGHVFTNEEVKCPSCGAARPDDGESNLPSWINDGKLCRWWSQSNSCYYDVRITKVDKEKRCVDIVFLIDEKSWKSVPFLHFKAPSKDWRLQPYEEKAEELRAKLPAWVQNGKAVSWWSDKQKRCVQAKICEVDCKRRVVIAKFEGSSQACKHVPFHQLIDDPESCYLQADDKSHEWRKKPKQVTAAAPADEAKKANELIQDICEDMDDFLDRGASGQIGVPTFGSGQASGDQEEANSAPKPPRPSSAVSASKPPDSMAAVESSWSFLEGAEQVLRDGSDTFCAELRGLAAEQSGAVPTEAQDDLPAFGGSSLPPRPPQAPGSEVGGSSLRQAAAGEASFGLAASAHAAPARAATFGDAEAPPPVLTPSQSAQLATSNEWTCSACDEVNKADRMRCRGCGVAAPAAVQMHVAASTVQQRAGSQAALSESGDAPRFGGSAPQVAAASTTADTSGLRDAAAVLSDSQHQEAALQDQPQEMNSPEEVGGAADESIDAGAAVQSDVEGDTDVHAGFKGRQGVRRSLSNLDELPTIGNGQQGKAKAAKEMRDALKGLEDAGEEVEAKQTREPSHRSKAGRPQATPAAQPGGEPVSLTKLNNLPSLGRGGQHHEQVKDMLAHLEVDQSRQPEPFPPPSDVKYSASETSLMRELGEAPRDRGDALRAAGDMPVTEDLKGFTALVDSLVSQESRSLKGREAPVSVQPSGPVWDDTIDIDQATESADFMRFAATPTAWGEEQAGPAAPTQEKKPQQQLLPRLHYALRVLSAEVWDSEAEGSAKPPDVAKLAEEWSKVEEDLDIAEEKASTKYRDMLEAEVEKQVLAVDNKGNELRKKVDMYLRRAEMEKNNDAMEQYRALSWGVADSQAKARAKKRHAKAAKLLLASRKVMHRKEALKKAVMAEAGDDAAVKVFMPTSYEIADLSSGQALAEVAEAARLVLRDLEVAALRPRKGKESVPPGSTSVFEALLLEAVPALAEALAALSQKLQKDMTEVPQHDKRLVEVASNEDGLTKDQKRERALFEAQQDFDWERRIEGKTTEQTIRSERISAEVVNRTETALTRRQRRRRDEGKGRTLGALQALTQSVQEAEAQVEKVWDDSSRAAAAEAAQLEAERRKMHDHTQTLVAAALRIRDEKARMAEAWMESRPQERQKMMRKILRRVRRLHADFRTLELEGELKQKHSVILYSLRMLEARLQGECPGSENDIQEEALKATPAIQDQLRQAHEAFERQLADEIAAVHDAHNRRARRVATDVARNHIYSITQAHGAAVYIAQVAIDKCAEDTSLAQYAPSSLRGLAAICAKLEVESRRHAEVEACPMEPAGFGPRPKQVTTSIQVTSSRLSDLLRQLKELERPQDDPKRHRDAQWQASASEAERQWHAFIAAYPEGDAVEEAQTPREGRRPSLPEAGLGIDVLGLDDLEDESPSVSPGASPGGVEGSPQPASSKPKKEKSRRSGADKKSHKSSGGPTASPPHKAPKAPPAPVPQKKPRTRGSLPGSGAQGSSASRAAELLEQLNEVSETMDRALGKPTQAPNGTQRPTSAIRPPSLNPA